MTRSAMASYPLYLLPRLHLRHEADQLAQPASVSHTEHRIQLPFRQHQPVIECSHSAGISFSTQFSAMAMWVVVGACLDSASDI